MYLLLFWSFVWLLIAAIAIDTYRMDPKLSRIIRAACCLFISACFGFIALSQITAKLLT